MSPKEEKTDEGEGDVWPIWTPTLEHERLKLKFRLLVPF